jgi:ribosome-interacting GTPase 1
MNLIKKTLITLYSAYLVLILKKAINNIKVILMKTIHFLRVFIVLFSISAISLYSQSYELKSAVDAKGYKYEYVTNDPLKVRIYTLNNGLKIYLKQNFDEPRIQTYIAVKAGSTYDPH